MYRFLKHPKLFARHLCRYRQLTPECEHLLISVNGEEDRPLTFNDSGNHFNIYTFVNRKPRCLPLRRRGRFLFALAWPLPRIVRSRRPRLAADDTRCVYGN
jgi:hypothetical protein